MQNIVVAQAQSAVDGFHQFRIRCHTGRSFCLQALVQSIQVLAYIVISLHILAILRRTIGDAFGSGKLAVHHNRLGILVIGDGFGLIFQSRSPGVESRIGCCPGRRFMIDIRL